MQHKDADHAVPWPQPTCLSQGAAAAAPLLPPLQAPAPPARPGCLPCPPAGARPALSPSRPAASALLRRCTSRPTTPCTSSAPPCPPSTPPHSVPAASCAALGGMPTSKYHPYKRQGGQAARCACCVRSTPAGSTGWVEIHVQGEAV
ncbi:hypothetical protein HaLaN_11836 [Haematococcus lacustris]|uniref:Uncharacterized protein n=1 Tax=Haematococcus lacustris TaxID=44745 RepID=A0A699Z225_HAELA|nr:hypothetical protein HaLaN_11836 [Haematococcus lacustris]